MSPLCPHVSAQGWDTEGVQEIGAESRNELRKGCCTESRILRGTGEMGCVLSF